MIDRKYLTKLLKAEEALYEKTHPKSKELFEKTKKNYVSGVPMLWMIKWAGNFPLFVKQGKGAHFEDVDGNKYIDFCLGDTGAMTGHAPSESVKAIQQQVAKGTTFMLPVEDSIWVGQELERRFGLPRWQFALTATDANRFAIRMCRMMTKRPKILVFNWCYHGTVDETFATLDSKGQLESRKGNMGPPVPLSQTTKVVEFNDEKALEEALKDEDVACVLAEPVMTNIGIVHPKPGFHQKLRELTKKYGTLLIIDETHTICTGIGGYTGKYGLEPDVLTLGKPIGGGMPCAVYGFSASVCAKLESMASVQEIDTGGIGGTLAGNALSIVAMKATLEHVLTPKFYETAEQMTVKLVKGINHVLEKYKLAWHVAVLGCRCEFWWGDEPHDNGGKAAASYDAELDRYMHLAALNRGILMTPFHNMALLCDKVTEQDIAVHDKVFEEIIRNLLQVSPKASL